jgi:hypothetical protein
MEKKHVETWIFSDAPILPIKFWCKITRKKDECNINRIQNVSKVEDANGFQFLYFFDTRGAEVTHSK